MIRLPRRLALWGGAAAVAAGGFAFMAQNVVGVSSAGEGVGAVTGYTVTHQTYGFTNTGQAELHSVTFTLTSMSTTSNANGQPANVQAYPQGPTGSRPWGKSLDCSLTGSWTTSGGQGTGKYTCIFAPNVTPIATYRSLDVEANQ